ncbi:MAG: transporter [Verrucomicrobiales bacterium]|nr:transporter [Verrucomicrobiales bacterium]
MNDEGQPGAMVPISTMEILSVSGLTVTRRGTRILRGVDWRVERGEMWTILGANGSGKTSLLSCLTGFLMPAAGTVTVLGETFGKSDWTQLKKRIGLVSSSVRQMVDDGERPRDVIGGGRYGQINFWGKFTAEDHRRIGRTARLVKCTPLLDRDWAVLSQGERQRVLTGRALMGEPELLILDEPCAGLDPVARDRFVHFMQRLAVQKRGPALVLVTHHLEEIPPACTHVLALHKGAVAAAGPIAEVLTDGVLSRIFGAKVEVLREEDGRWGVRVGGAGKGAF